MRIPTIRGIIDRRLLVNYRADPDVLEHLLPAPFRPHLVGDVAIAGICLIRLRNARPWFLPEWVGISSENAALRIAVNWTEAGRTHTGVYVPRRDSASIWNCLAGGRVFPGVYGRARFQVQESGESIQIRMQSSDTHSFEFVGRIAKTFPVGSVFGSLEAASAFFRAGSLGYSPSVGGKVVDGLELRCTNWSMEPVEVDHVTSSYFDDRNRFPPGSIEFDSALAMYGIPHEWSSARSLLCCPAAGEVCPATPCSRGDVDATF